MTRLIVLPFRVLRPDPDTDFLAFSLPDAIVASLSGLDSLVVRSSLVASQFAGAAPDLEALATQADVDIVLTGTLLRAGDRLRFSAQLLEAPAGTVLWSHAAEGTTEDLFQLQDDLARRIVESLSVPLTAREDEQLHRDMPASARAYELYLRANQLGRDQQWVLARDLYRRCLAADPRFAPAWARLGRMYRNIGKWEGEEPQANLARAEEAFGRALALNPELGLAHNLYTHLEVGLGRAQDAMMRLLDRARTRAADPELFSGLVQACRCVGLIDASIAAHERAERLEPRIKTGVYHSYFARGDFEAASSLAMMMTGREAEAIARLRTFEETAQHRGLYVAMATTMRALAEGHRDECLAAMDRHVAAVVDDPEVLFHYTRVSARLGERTRALGLFDRVVDGGFVCFPWMEHDPWLDPLRGDPEFTRLLGVAERRHREAAEAFQTIGSTDILLL